MQSRLDSFAKLNFHGDSAMQETSDLSAEWAKQRVRMQEAVLFSNQVDESMRVCIQLLKDYNQHRKTTNCPAELDFGLMAELMVQQEIAVQLP